MVQRLPAEDFHQGPEEVAEAQRVPDRLPGKERKGRGRRRKREREKGRRKENSKISTTKKLDFFSPPKKNFRPKQVGNLTVDKRHWTRPEDMDRKTHKRPAYYVTTYNGTSDLAGQLVAAFASSSIAFRGVDDKYSDKLMTAALRLYGAATRHSGRYTKPFLYKCAPDDPNAQLRAPNKPQCKPADVVFKGSAVGLFNSTSYRDDLTWAAAWMNRATGDRAYLDDAYKYYVQHSNEEGQADQRLLVDWDHVAWPATVLLASITDDAAFHKPAQDFLARWLCTSSVVSYTDLGRAYNHFDPRVGTTMNVAMLSAVYGTLERRRERVLVSGETERDRATPEEIEKLTSILNFTSQLLLLLLSSQATSSPPTPPSRTGSPRSTTTP